MFYINLYLFNILSENDLKKKKYLKKRELINTLLTLIIKKK